MYSEWLIPELALLLLDERVSTNEFIAFAFVRHEFANCVCMFDGVDISKQKSPKSYCLGGKKYEKEGC